MCVVEGQSSLAHPPRIKNNPMAYTHSLQGNLPMEPLALRCSWSTQYRAFSNDSRLLTA